MSATKKEIFDQPDVGSITDDYKISVGKGSGNAARTWLISSVKTWINSIAWEFTNKIKAPDGTTGTEVVNFQQLSEKASLTSDNSYTGTQTYNDVKTFQANVGTADAATQIFNDRCVLDFMFKNVADDETGYFKVSFDPSLGTVKIITSWVNNLNLGTTSSGDDINIYNDGGILTLQASSAKAFDFDINGMIR
jgi:hypothetical protein